jgi:hypothetical protein
MSTMRQSPVSQSLAREQVVHISSHLPSHLLQPPWREVRVAFLDHLPHSPFLLLFGVILFINFLFSLILTLIRIHFIYSFIFYFPAHEVPSSEVSRDDILADPSIPAGVVSSGFHTGPAVTGLYTPFRALLVVLCLCFLMTHRLGRSWG